MERIRNIIKVDHKKNAQLPKGVAGIPTPKKINCYPETMAKLHLAEHNAAIEQNREGINLNLLLSCHNEVHVCFKKAVYIGRWSFSK